MAESAVNDVAHLVEVIYTRFILRDLIGKVVPGAIALIGISVALFGWPKVHDWMEHPNGVEIILLAALCWLSTICVQWLGEVGLPWVKYGWMVPKIRSGKKTENFWKRQLENKVHFNDKRKNLNKFLDVAGPDHRAIYERFVVIREAAGNSSTAVLIVLLSVPIRYVIRFFKYPIRSAINLSSEQHTALVVCGMVAAYSLRAMYYEHKHRQDDYVQLTVAHPPRAKAVE